MEFTVRYTRQITVLFTDICVCEMHGENDLMFVEIVHTGLKNDEFTI